MFNPIDFFTLAKNLAPQSEAKVRTIISRAYYAPFLLARDAFQLSFDLPRVHEVVIRELYKRGWILMANKLQQLRMLRNRADYDTNIILTALEAKRALNLADFIIVGFKKQRRR